jgi:hypothetical protein
MADDSCPTLLGTLDFLKFPDIPNLDINESIQPKIDDINNKLSSMSDMSSQGELVVPSELSENQSSANISSKFSDSNSKEVSIDDSSNPSESNASSNQSEQSNDSSNLSEESNSSSNPSESNASSNPSEPEDVFYTPASSESELSSMSDEKTDKKQSGGRKKK